MYKIIEETDKNLTIALLPNKFKEQYPLYLKKDSGLLLCIDANKNIVFQCKLKDLETTITKWVEDNDKPNVIYLKFYLDDIKSKVNKQKVIALKEKRANAAKKLDIKPNDILNLYRGSGGYHGLQIKKFLVESVNENSVVGWYYDNEIKSYYTSQEYWNIKSIIKHG